MRPEPSSTEPGEVSDLRVLVVEDTETTAQLIRRALEADGMRVEVVANLKDAEALLAVDLPAVLVLDIELPDGSGLDLLRDLEVSGSVPVLILSSRREEVDRVTGLELGAEDYMVKPFFPRELAARVRLAAGRRPNGRAVPSNSLAFDGLLIDRASREVRVGKAPIELTDREFDLLVHMASSPREVFSREDLLRSVWHSSPDWQTPKTVTEHVRRVRQKIEQDPRDPRWIVTVGRVGYRFES